MTPAEYADLLHGKKPKRLGLKKAKEEHISNWTPNSNSQEPYIIGEIYQPEKVDQGMIDNGYDKFTIPKIHI